MSSLSSLYYPVYHNLPLYTFIPEYTSLFTLPSAAFLPAVVKQRSGWYTPIGVRRSAVERGQIRRRKCD